MFKRNSKKIEKLKKQDKELSKLPSIEDEKRRFRKGESLLERLLRPKKLEVNPKEVRRAGRAVSKKTKTVPGKKKSAKKK